jgi:hypothetical protein
MVGGRGERRQELLETLEALVEPARRQIQAWGRSTLNQLDNALRSFNPKTGRSIDNVDFQMIRRLPAEAREELCEILNEIEQSLLLPMSACDWIRLLDKPDGGGERPIGIMMAL